MGTRTAGRPSSHRSAADRTFRPSRPVAAAAAAGAVAAGAVVARAGAAAPKAPGPRPRPAPDAQSWLLRGGLAFAFAYAAVAMLVDHTLFARYAPAALQQPGVAGLARPAFAAYELALAAGLVLGRRVFLAAALAAVTLVAIVLLNLDAFGVLFRNVPIACAAAALALGARPDRR